MLYAYARGTRSSRQIERACEEDVAFRVLAAQQRPDHATVARFVERHQDAIAGLFGEVLSLCAKQGLASVGVIAVDGTKLPGNAAATRTSITSSSRARSSKRPKRVDAAEDELYGEARGDELPAEFATGEGRRGWLREAKQPLEGRAREEAAAGAAQPPASASRRPSAAWTRSSGPRCAPTAPMRHYRAAGA